MSTQIPIRVTEVGAANFSGEFTDFQESVQANNQMPDDYCPIIMGISYNSQGTAHTQDLFLAPTALVADDLKIPLHVPGDPINSFSILCGACGIVVPRFTLGGTGLGGSQVPYILAFETFAPKDDDGTLLVWYKWDRVSA